MKIQTNWFFTNNEYRLTGIILLGILLVALFIRIIGVRKFSSKIYAIINELKYCKVLVMWYAKTLFLDSEARFQYLMNALNTILQPTPYKVNSFIYPFVYIDKPEDLQILLNNADSLEKAGMYKFTDLVLENSLATITVHKWKSNKRAVNPIFNSHSLKKSMHYTNKWSRLFTHELRTKADTNEVIDLWDYISILFVNITLGTKDHYEDVFVDTKIVHLENIENLMGIDPSVALTTPEIRRHMWITRRFSKHIVDRVERLWLHPKIIHYIVHYNIEGLFPMAREILEFMSNIIRERRRILLKGRMRESEKNETELVLLDTLCDLHPSVEGEEISESLKHEVFQFFIAAYESSSQASCFTLLMLAMNPSIQNQLHQEIDKILSKKEVDIITAEDVEKMHLLDRCIKESLRLYPPAIVIGRSTTADIKLSNDEIVKKNTGVLIVPYLVHRKPELYENPLVWNPDNFLPEAVRKRHPYSFISFSGGPRGCIGAKYGMLSIKTTLATILRKYHLTTEMSMNDVRHEFEFLLRSSKGWKVKLHTRH